MRRITTSTAAMGCGCAGLFTSAEVEHAPDGALRAHPHVLFENDREDHSPKSLRRLFEGDHLHVLAELARLVEPLLRQLEKQPIGEPALGDHEKVFSRALAGILD